MSDIIKDKRVKAALTEQSSRDNIESNPSPAASKNRTSVVIEKKFHSTKSEKATTNVLKKMKNDK